MTPHLEATSVATSTERGVRLNLASAPRRCAWGMSPLSVTTGTVRNCRIRRLTLLLVSRVLVKTIAEPMIPDESPDSSTLETKRTVKGESQLEVNAVLGCPPQKQEYLRKIGGG